MFFSFESKPSTAPITAVIPAHTIFKVIHNLLDSFVFITKQRMNEIIMSAIFVKNSTLMKDQKRLSLISVL